MAVGSERAFVGTVFTGNDVGKIIDAFTNSSTYGKIMKHGMSVSFRDIAKFCDVAFSGPTDPRCNYVVSQEVPQIFRKQI